MIRPQPPANKEESQRMVILLNPQNVHEDRGWKGKLYGIELDRTIPLSDSEPIRVEESKSVSGCPPHPPGATALHTMYVSEYQL